ncbi:MAG TPA: 1-acyl-sn-glycerol-3-phosphate acyltransferase [Roseiflexaceae bacterium]|nr:1-acyl-sn-glycerol-3-phosphate acyltransferase [Roseiflexaceae bacterium]
MDGFSIASKQSEAERAQIDDLTRLNADDLVHAFKLDRAGPLRGVFHSLARIPARRFSRQILAFDNLVGEQGLAAGGRYIMKMFARQFDIFGDEYIPEQGPLLVVCNHPGMADAMALWVALERRADIRIIAAERELLNAVPNTSRYLMYVAERSGGRTGLLRAAAQHMRSGGAILNFPAGHIEPDPTVSPGALDSLQSWSQSVALFLRLVPEATLLPAAVGGVISGTAMRNPVIRFLPTEKERDWAAATLQVLIPAYRDTHTRVAFGPPVAAHELLALGDAAAIARAVTRRVAPLLAQAAGGSLLL